jgi:hypothetical protein
VTPLSFPIVDMTGVTGRYRMALQVTLADVSAEVGIEASMPGFASSACSWNVAWEPFPR